MKGRKILAGIIGIAAIGCLGTGLTHLWQERYAGKEYEASGNCEDADHRDHGGSAGGTDGAAEEMEETAEPPDIPVDFEGLQEYNPDIYAWITIPGTAVDYPIVQRPEDNSYYLTHNTDGEESAEGAIFTEDYNSRDFTDPNTVIYGHNMRNGSMFRSLHNYMDRSFFDENRKCSYICRIKFCIMKYLPLICMTAGICC